MRQTRRQFTSKTILKPIFFTLLDLHFGQVINHITSSILHHSSYLPYDDEWYVLRCSYDDAAVLMIAFCDWPLPLPLLHSWFYPPIPLFTNILCTIRSPHKFSVGHMTPGTVNHIGLITHIYRRTKFNTAATERTWFKFSHSFTPPLSPYQTPLVQVT